MPQQLTVLTPEDLRLEQPCQVCAATGSVWHGCSKCKGCGWVPTPFGQAVLEFLQHHWPPQPGGNFPP